MKFHFYSALILISSTVYAMDEVRSSVPSKREKKVRFDESKNKVHVVEKNIAVPERMTRAQYMEHVRVGAEKLAEQEAARKAPCIFQLSTIQEEESPATPQLPRRKVQAYDIDSMMDRMQTVGLGKK